jgi:hypothetical protein
LGCTNCSKQIKGDIIDIIPKMKSNSYVIFISCVLEFIKDLDYLYNELKRVSGNDLYIVYVKKPIIYNNLFNGYYDNNTFFKFVNYIYSAPPYEKEFKYYKLN